MAYAVEPLGTVIATHTLIRVLILFGSNKVEKENEKNVKYFLYIYFHSTNSEYIRSFVPVPMMIF